MKDYWDAKIRKESLNGWWMDKRIRSSLQENGACLPIFLQFIFYTFFTAASLPISQSPVSIRYPIILNQMENVVWRWKGRVIPEYYSNQRQGNATTSRSLNVMYVREIKQDSGLQFCELFRFFLDTQRIIGYCRTWGSQIRLIWRYSMQYRLKK